MYKRRLLEHTVKELFSLFPVVVISGARQVGKSTMLRNLFPELKSFVFDPIVDVGGARADPELFFQNTPSPVILDEIQYAPELIATIKRIVDQQEQRPGQFLITGSQQWSVMKSLSESLAGRCVLLDLHPFALTEVIEQATGLPWLLFWLNHFEDIQHAAWTLSTLTVTPYEQIWRGFMPKAQELSRTAIPYYHQSYMKTYIERDVRLLSEVADLHTFGRFYQLLAALTAQELNYSQLGRDIHITPQTAERWKGILQAGYQWFELPAYSGNAIKRLSGKPKGYFFDTGLACMAQYITTPETLGVHPLWGSLFETAIASEILKQLSAQPHIACLYHWRSHGGAEVDIIIEKDGILFPIEVKAKTAISRRDVRGLQAFRDTYPQAHIAKGLIIYLGTELRLVTEHDYAVPWNACFLGGG